MGNKQHLNLLKFKIKHHFIFILVICLTASACEDVSWFGEEVSTENNNKKVEVTPNTEKKIDAPIEKSTLGYEIPSTDQLLNASVKIILEQNNRILGSGSGVFISSNLIVTNEHVIQASINRGVKIKVQCDDGSEYFAKLEKVNPDNDVAIIKINGSQSIFIPKIQSSLPNVMDEIIVIGSPLGEKNVTTTGQISKIVNDDSLLDETYLLMTAPISPGSSGGPVFNKSGEIIGITVAMREEAQNMNYAVPSKYIQRLLEGIK